MKLIDILNMISKDLFPPTLQIDKYSKCIDTWPESIYKVTICFMCEEETWITCNIQNEILVPWYECEVRAIEPGTDHTLEIRLKDVDYLQEHWPQHLFVEGEEDKDDK